MTISLNRRDFGVGLAGLGLVGLLPQLAFAQDARSITTVLGPMTSLPTPRRVICIDSRLDLEPAVALGLNIIGHAYGAPEPWVPSNPDWVFLGEMPDLEKVLALDPDLIICTDVGDHDSDDWPINRLKDVAPVLPPAYVWPWKEIVAKLGEWTGRQGAADSVLAELSLLQPQVLADLGGRTLLPNDNKETSAENFGTSFGAVDGVLLVNHGEGLVEELAANPLWTRLPAVSSGKVMAPLGNTNFGGVHTAIHIAKLFDELYGMLA